MRHTCNSTIKFISFLVELQTLQLKTIKQKIENRDIMVSKSNYATNQTLDEMLRTLEENKNNIMVWSNNVNQSILDKTGLKQTIIEKLGILQKQQQQVVNGFNSNAILQNKIFRDTFLNFQDNEDIIRELPISIKEMNSKLVSKLTQIFNAYLRSLETNTLSAKSLESSLNQKLLVINNGFSDMRKNQERDQKNISESYSSIHDELIKLETGLLIFHVITNIYYFKLR